MHGNTKSKFIELGADKTSHSRLNSVPTVKCANSLAVAWPAEGTVPGGECNFEMNGTGRDRMHRPVCAPLQDEDLSRSLPTQPVIRV